MAANNKIFVSPGVYTSEKDLSFVTQSVGVTTLGIAGETQKGPAFEPIFIKDYSEFETFFGGTSPEKFTNTQIPKYEAAYIAKSYLSQSNQLYVSRILGLSGYDAGPSWSILVNANMDPETVSLSSCTTYCMGGQYLTSGCTTTPSTSFTIDFTGDTCSINNIQINISSNLTSVLGSKLTEEYQQFNGSISTIEEDIKEQIFALMQNNALSGTSIYYFGSIPSGNTLSAYTDSVNVFNVASPTTVDELSSRLNDSWYFATFNQFDPNTEVLPNSESVTPNYSGISFYTTNTSLTFVNEVCVTGSTPTTTSTTTDPCSTPMPTPLPITPIITCCKHYTGQLSGKIHFFFGKQFNEYQDLVVATLRSRGVTNYTSGTGPEYEIVYPNVVGMDCNVDEFSMIKNNPFNSFAITGFTGDNMNSKFFKFKTSLRQSDKNYIDRVFGTNNFDKPKNEVPLFIEEDYSNLLIYGWNKGYIRGLQCNLLSLDGARSIDTESIGNYLDRYKTPLTPFLVSELRGNKLYKLFRFHSISDGTNANTEIKISIANISFKNNSFDVLVRSFSDTDDHPVILERYSNCSMNPTSNNFVGKRIGTNDGEYELKSKYVMVEISDESPIDALPCGFEGYLTREYSSKKSPFPIFKTKYDYAGEVVFNPPFGNLYGGENSIRSGGDKVRTTYLGISSDLLTDPDFFYYKGKKKPVDLCLNSSGDEWLYKTKGFHMDMNVGTITIPSGYKTAGKPAFEVGVTTFVAEPTYGDAYYTLQSRKFTLFFQGGFDGWDIYSESRTNGNEFKIGRNSYQQGACPSIKYPTASGLGLFKEISFADDSNEYANTDYYAYLYGIRQFANPESIVINVLATPGIDMVNNSDLVEDVISMVETERADSLYIATLPDTDLFNPLTPEREDIYSSDDVVNQLDSVGMDSNYTATYFPWILIKDSVNNTQIYIPPTGEVCRNLALTDNIAYPWFASAGYNRGTVNSIKARKELKQGDRDILYSGRINPIATFKDSGPLIWGNKTLQIKDTALNRIGVRRLLLEARKLISAVSVRLIFEQNDSKLKQDFLSAVNPILEGIRRDRGIYDFRVTVSQTADDIDKNQLVGKIYLKPTKALEFISLEFLLTPTGASFEDI